MEYEITGICRVRLEHKPGSKTSTHVKTYFNMQVSSNVDNGQFLKDEVPTEAGVKALTQCFVQGLIGNIHYAQKMGYWKDADHLRDIITKLELGFATPNDVMVTKFDEDKS